MTAVRPTERAAAERPGLMRLEDALARMLDGVVALPAETVALADAHGRVLALSIDSALTLPPWDNSAMDGFAVCAADTMAAAAVAPVRLRVVGEVAAGRSPAVHVEAGTAVRIMTGAPLPAGADAVVPVEETDAAAGAAALPEVVAIFRAAEPGAHVRRAGSDLRAGGRLLEAGCSLGPAELAVAAAGGYGELPVHRRPRLAVLATGDELVAPGAPLGAAQIPDSNTVGLQAMAREAGARAQALGISGDRLGEVIGALRRGLGTSDVIVVSGGVSVGAHDVVKDAFAELGTLELWRVAVQPGKPLAFGRAVRPGHEGDPPGRAGDPPVLLFGLPGNPVSSLVTFELFVRPVLRRLAGHADLNGRDVVRATLSEPVRKDPARRAFLRVRLERGADGGWRAALAGGQGSHVLSALAAADGLAVIPEGVATLPAGADVEVLRLRNGTRSGAA
jgi:molybdopterin molybdotransferase